MFTFAPVEGQYGCIKTSVKGGVRNDISGFKSSLVRMARLRLTDARAAAAEYARVFSRERRCLSQDAATGILGLRILAERIRFARDFR
jgi:hypothetical protein